MMRPARLALAAAALAMAGAAGATPAAGRYDAQFCVALSAQAPRCGPVEVALGADGAAIVRAADIVYVLRLRPTELDLVLMQGTMQLDEFTVPYRWVGDALHFADDEKSARYEVRFGKRRP
ncbi:MAG: hypothetical protein JSR59_03100 [Proteobacteria bacterium]|nr:hypothetical protein [Pseudomonadota bacterium]